MSTEDYYDGLIGGKWKEFSMSFLDIKIDFDGMRDTWSYQGLDPTAVFIKMLKIAKKAGIAMERFKMDMFTLTFVACIRGVKWGTTKFQNKSTEQAISELTTLMTRYEVTTEKTPKPNDATPQRFLVLFPEVYKAALFKSAINPIVVSNEIPIEMQFPQAPSTMTESEWKEFGLLWLKWSVAVTHTLSGKSLSVSEAGDKVHQETAEKQHNFAKIGRESQYTSATAKSSRVAFLQLIGMNEEEYAKHLTAFIKSRREVSPTHWDGFEHLKH